MAHVSEKTSPWHEIGPNVAKAREVESNNGWLYQAAERYEICQELVKELGDIACGDPSCAKPMQGKRVEPKHNPILCDRADHRRNQTLLRKGKSASQKRGTIRLCHTLVGEVVNGAAKLAERARKERVKFGSKIILSVVNGAISKSVKMKRLRDSEEKNRRKASKKRKVEERDAGSKDYDAEVEQSKKRQKYNNKEGVAGSSKEQSVEKRTGNYEYLESEKNVFFNKFGTLQEVNNGTGRKEHNSKIARRTTGARENLIL